MLVLDEGWDDASLLLSKTLSNDASLSQTLSIEAEAANSLTVKEIPMWFWLCEFLFSTDTDPKSVLAAAEGGSSGEEPNKILHSSAFLPEVSEF